MTNILLTIAAIGGAIKIIETTIKGIKLLDEQLVEWDWQKKYNERVKRLSKEEA